MQQFFFYLFSLRPYFLSEFLKAFKNISLLFVKLYYYINQ